MKNKEHIPEIGLIGISHKTAPVSIRENFSFDDDKLSELIKTACGRGIDEIVCLSTCNRMEIYFTSNEIIRSCDELCLILEEMSSVSAADLKNIIYKKYYKDAVFHLLSVASSLDSMVLGENEILGQVKDAYRKSTHLKKTGLVLNRLFHQAFATAKRVRNETEIAKSPLSVAYIAVELAKSIFDDLSKRKALLVGAGEMGELIVKYLVKYKINDITIANRSFHNAKRIAEELNIAPHIKSLDDLKSASSNTDIIITSTASPDYIITNEIAKDIQKFKRNDPLFLIDIAVPRNIDPDVGKLNNIFLYNIDDLQVIANENLKNKLKEVELAKSLIETDTEKFIKWYEELSIVPVIISIQNKFDKIRKNELNKYRKRSLKHLSSKDLELIENLTNQIMTKTLHDPIMYLKDFQNYNAKEKEAIIDNLELIEKLFGMKL